MKLELPNTSADSKHIAICRFKSNTVYRNIGDVNCYAYLNNDSVTHVIMNGALHSFYDEYDAKTDVTDAGLPDLWEETALSFVVSIK